MNIDLITQHDGKSCVYACIAMIASSAGRDVTSRSIEEAMSIGGRKESSLLEEFHQWVRLGFFPTLHTDNSLRHDQVCLVTVPSLNNLGGNHRIVIDSRDEGGLAVLDPNQGRDGVKVYSESSLCGWSEKTTVVDCKR